jgi:hypothetical protein
MGDGAHPIYNLLPMTYYLSRRYALCAWCCMAHERKIF